MVRGTLDSVIGIFDADTGDLLIADDDGGNGLLSRLLLQANEDITVAVAVSSFPDVEFVGVGDDQGTLFAVHQHVSRRRRSPSVTTTRCRWRWPGHSNSRARSATRCSSNSNGSLSFGAGDTSFDATVPAFLAGPPRISPLWTDLDPTGFLGNPGLVLVDASAKPAAVHFVSVSEFFSSNPNYFTAELGDQGKITLKWGPTARGEALVGVDAGRGRRRSGARPT